MEEEEKRREERMDISAEDVAAAGPSGLRAPPPDRLDEEGLDGPSEDERDEPEERVDEKEWGKGKKDKGLSKGERKKAKKRKEEDSEEERERERGVRRALEQTEDISREKGELDELKLSGLFNILLDELERRGERRRSREEGESDRHRSRRRGERESAERKAKGERSRRRSKKE